MNKAPYIATTLALAIAGTLLLPRFATGQGDAGSPDKAKLDKVFPSKPNYSPYAGAATRRCRCSATRTCTPRSRWTRAPSAPA
jgi:hypothetical protein